MVYVILNLAYSKEHMLSIRYHILFWLYPFQPTDNTLSLIYAL